MGQAVLFFIILVVFAPAAMIMPTTTDAFLYFGQQPVEQEEDRTTSSSSSGLRVMDTADVIVVGSGPGGTGFLYRFTQIRPDMTVLWIEQGRDDIEIPNWPEDLFEPTNEDILLGPIPRTSSKVTSTNVFVWNTFGGGDTGNSGGPNQLGLDRSTDDDDDDDRPDVYTEVDVAGLRNNSITPMTPSSRRWMESFTNVGYNDVGGALIERSRANADETTNDYPPYGGGRRTTRRVGQVSTLQSEDGRGPRRSIARQVRDDSQNNVKYVHARITKVLHDPATGKAIGVQGIQLDDQNQPIQGHNDNDDDNDELIWEANHAVVLAAGVFGTFNLLIESGIGSKRDLQTRRIPQSEWWTGESHEEVGKGVGDELFSIFSYIDPDEQDTLGAESKLSADSLPPIDEQGNIEEGIGETAFIFWSAFSSDVLLRLQSTLASSLFDFVSYIPFLNERIVDHFFTRVSTCSMSLETEPVMSIRARPKPSHSSSSFFFFFSWLFGPPSSSKSDNGILYLELDDSQMEFTDKMCNTLISNLDVWTNFAARIQDVPFATAEQEQAKKDFDLLEWLGFFDFITPRTLTMANVDDVTEDDCRSNLLISYFHYYGGSARIIDGTYQVQGTTGLFISDASVFARLAPGGACSVIMQEGMRVADQVADTIGQGNQSD